MPRRRTTDICNRQLRHAIEGEMAKRGLTYGEIAERRGCDVRSVREFFRDIGTRHHHIGTLTKFSRALGKPGDWLLNLLHDNGFHH